MIYTDKPRLCGGTFFVLLLRAKRTRAKKEIQKFGNGGVTNPELLKSLIFNITQSGNGINIGYAEKVEIRDGKVVTLK